MNREVKTSSSKFIGHGLSDFQGEWIFFQAKVIFLDLTGIEGGVEAEVRSFGRSVGRNEWGGARYDELSKERDGGFPRTTALASSRSVSNPIPLLSSPLLLLAKDQRSSTTAAQTLSIAAAGSESPTIKALRKRHLWLDRVVACSV